MSVRFYSSTNDLIIELIEPDYKARWSKVVRYLIEDRKVRFGDGTKWHSCCTSKILGSRNRTVQSGSYIDTRRWSHYWRRLFQVGETESSVMKRQTSHSSPALEWNCNGTGTETATNWNWNYCNEWIAVILANKKTVGPTRALLCQRNHFRRLGLTLCQNVGS